MRGSRIELGEQLADHQEHVDCQGHQNDLAQGHQGFPGNVVGTEPIDQLKRENDEPREPLATKKGINNFLDKYGLAKKSFPQQTIVAAKGKYVELLDKLRSEIGEGK